LDTGESAGVGPKHPEFVEGAEVPGDHANEDETDT
jgi:hypothetical protein